MVISDCEIITNFHCIKNVCIRSYSGPYFGKMWENTDQNNSKYKLFYAVSTFI